MNILKRKIKVKDIYLILIIVLGLITISLYSTYALFTGSVVSTENIANVSTDINIDFDINSNKTFTLDPNTIVYFNANIKNNMTGSIYYELYHDFDLASHPKVTIGEVVADPKVITTAPNTSGTLEAGSRKTVPIIIENNSSETITVNIGLAVGYIGNDIEYGTNNYPSNVTLITGVYDDDKVPSESCASSGPSVGEDCTISYKIEEINGISQAVQIIKCPSELENADLSGASVPVLRDGMIPIKWDSSNNVVKADMTNPSSDIWYDYNNQKWANAVLVTESSRSNYMNASSGTPVQESDILAYFVWIPRYRYKLFNVSSTSGMSPQVIEVIFENASTSKSNGSTNGTYLTHPAFSYIDTDGTNVELNGIWVGKFETTGSTTNPTIKPGITSLKNINISSMYQTAQNMNSIIYLTTDGITQADIHMMKNLEWGAVAYLKQSKYGLGITDITANNNSSYITGGGTGTTYLNNGVQSTTGNIYGVYDMSGGSFEYMMANYNTSAGNSGLTISNIPAKYRDVYTSTSIASGRKLGDATGETQGWYGDGVYFITNNGWFIRSGNYGYAAEISGVFFFDGKSQYYGTGSLGGASASTSFRIVIF